MISSGSYPRISFTLPDAKVYVPFLSTSQIQSAELSATSWNLLSDEEKVALAKLSVFRGGFSKDAARQVAGASVFLLSALVDKSLTTKDSAGRYGMHEVIRQYAQSKLESRVRTEITKAHCC